MRTVPALERIEGDRSSYKTGFFLLVFGVSFLSAGVIIATFGFQSCDRNGGSCNVILKATGPSLCGIALVFLLLSRSKSLVNLRQLAHSADQRCFLSCSEQDTFARFLIFGILFCFSGVLLTMIGVWAITCPGTKEGEGFNLTGKTNGNEKCKLLFLQIMGPVVTFIGICFLLIAHVKKKVTLNPEEECPSRSNQQPHRSGPCQIAIDNSVLVLPPPPPYFPEPPPIVNDYNGICQPVPSDSPPSYYSVIYCRTQADESSNSNMMDVRLILTRFPAHWLIYLISAAFDQSYQQWIKKPRLQMNNQLFHPTVF
ncbi:transmembrane protein 171 isoform X1 [Rhincodon typus]|nr:transmembrane protein 171 isoform X1 [Rhincodon typus]XP_048476255.1 transmembrane protein 171 isoform X1 [Rhincodon typus]